MANFPGILPGRALFDNEGNVGPFKQDQQLAGGRSGSIEQAPPPRGIFAEFGGSTPKYAFNQGMRDADFRETLARMYLEIADARAYEAFVASVPEESRKLARVIAGTSGVGGAGYVDFLLHRIDHTFQEKMDVIETLADNYVSYFFGQAAPTFVYSGTLVNSVQDDQAVNMFRLYEDILRGSQLAQRKQLVKLKYDSYIIAGTMTNLQMSIAGENEMVCPFSFNLLVKRISILPNDDYGLVRLTTPFFSSSGVPSNAITRADLVPTRTTALPTEKTASSALETLQANASASA